MIFLLMLVSCVCPIMALPCILGYYSKTKRVKTCAFLFGLAFAAALYGYVADQGNDIYRHIYYLKYYDGKTLLHAFDAGPWNMVYVWDIWQWIIVNLRNKYLLQSSGALVGYTILSFMVLDYAKRRDLSPKQWCPAIILAMLTISPLTLAIGIRSGNALLICALAIYMYFVHKKGYFFVLLVILATVFLHHSTIIILLLWLVFPVFKKHPLLGVVILLIALFSYTNYGAYISLFMGEGSVLESLGSDLQQSVVTYTAETQTNLHRIITVTLQTLFVSCLFLRSGGIQEVLALRNHTEDNKESRNISVFQIMLLVTIWSFMVLLSFNGNRYYVMAFALAFVPLMDSFSNKPFLKNKRCFFLDLFIIGTATIYFCIILRDMNWGTGSLLSLLASVFTGFFSRLAFAF